MTRGMSRCLSAGVIGKNVKATIVKGLLDLDPVVKLTLADHGCAVLAAILFAPAFDGIPTSAFE